MDYFRAVLLADELSERAFELTNDALRINAANYTAWVFRRKLIRHLDKDLHAELAFVRDLALSNPKNYQIWHHRREVVTVLNDGSLELGFTHKALKDDQKNYHAWAHRQWAIDKFDLWDQELSFVDMLLAQDIRNNSAWNQRWFVLHRGQLKRLSNDECQRELEYCFTAIRRTPNNESPWNYVRALWRKYRQREEDSQRHENEATCCCTQMMLTECLLIQQTCPTCVFAAACLADIYDRQGRTAECRSVLQHLSSTLDPIRQPYWQLRLSQLARLA